MKNQKPASPKKAPLFAPKAKKPLTVKTSVKAGENAHKDPGP